MQANIKFRIMQNILQRTATMSSEQGSWYLIFIKNLQKKIYNIIMGPVNIKSKVYFIAYWRRKRFFWPALSILSLLFGWIEVMAYTFNIWLMLQERQQDLDVGKIQS